MKVKSQNGSITIFVLVALLFYMAFLLLLYANNLNKIQTISEKAETLKSIYAKNVENIDEIYNRKKGIQIGDYVNYTPTPVTLTADSQVVKDLQEYSGYTGTDYNTENTIVQEKLKWRVLDITDDGTVRLISDAPTTSKVYLAGYNGYNNAVYLLDEVCNTLYKGNNGTAQNLKIEDIEDKTTYDYTEYQNTNVDTGKYGGTKEYTSSSYRAYPSIFAKEKTGEVDGVAGTDYGISEQTELILQSEKYNAVQKIKMMQTFWQSTLSASSFENSIYYNLILADEKGSYPKCWVSSRCVTAMGSAAHFYVRKIEYRTIGGCDLYHSGGAGQGYENAFRPVVTLNSNVKLVKDTATDTWNIQ